MCFRVAVAVAVAVSFNAFAGDAPKKEEKPAAKPAEPAKADAPPAPPTLPPEGKRWIEGHLGSWKSNDVVMKMGDKEMKGKMNLKCDKASNGWATLCQGKAEFPKPMPAQNVTFLFGWNVGDGEATLFEVSDMAETHHHRGKWTDEKTITVTHEGKNAEGKLEKDALTFTWVSAKELGIKAEGTVGGQTLWTFSATAKK